VSTLKFIVHLQRLITAGKRVFNNIAVQQCPYRMEPIVLEDVSHTYAGQSSALRNVSIALPANAITVIVGESGSGKSTLLQLVNGLVKPETGRVILFGQPLNYKNLNLMRSKVGYCVQGAGLFPHLTVEQNIALAFRIFPRPEVSLEQRIKELMDMMTLPQAYRKRYPFELSGGEQQRVGICRALFNSPPVLLMDEPFSAVDAISRGDLQEKITAFQRAGNQTILLVTHDLREAAKLGEYTLVLKKGSVQQFAKTSVVLSQPSNDYVRDLIRTSL
jgi:osmoprotectant transport system ATP-binding protein